MVSKVTQRDAKTIAALRRLINESLRIQKDTDSIDYIDVGSVLQDILARQNHVVFGRRGCGKSLLLHFSATKAPEGCRVVYINCEDFKNHTFPNVLIEVLDSLMRELEKTLRLGAAKGIVRKSGNWIRSHFGHRRTQLKILRGLRDSLGKLKDRADERVQQVRQANTTTGTQGVVVATGVPGVGGFRAGTQNATGATEERQFELAESKLRVLQQNLPSWKRQLEDFIEASPDINTLFLQVDDFYHLRRADQPKVMDYLHRLCKDLPLYFKAATLKHASLLFQTQDGQPVGAQERHDFQPIDVDFTFDDFARTAGHNREILHGFGARVGLSKTQIDDMFKGEGFERLVMASGGVPREFLSLFLQVLTAVGLGRIGKDDVRVLSRETFQRRIEELKQDSAGEDQTMLVNGAYTIQRFCLDRMTNVFCVPDKLLQQRDDIRGLVYRLLDYRIIHSVAAATTHKSQEGTFHAFAIDMGCYAQMRVLEGKLNEIELGRRDTREAIRSTPVLDETTFDSILRTVPQNPIQAMLAEADS